MLFERLTPENYPLVVLARSGNPCVEQSLRERNLSVVRCEAEPDLVNDRGMPQHTDRLYPLEDALADQLTALDVGAFHVASVTGNRLRQIIYSHSLPVNFDAMLGAFDIQGYSLRSLAPSDRDALIELVSPTELDRQLNDDRRVISNLQEHGDDVRIPRKTDFWFYGPPHAVQNVAAELEPWGLSIDHWLDDPEGIVLTAHLPVDFDAFREITPVLVSTAERHQTRYDGWETLVVQADGESREIDEQKPQSLLSKLFGAKRN
jgi:hypothetical protein